MTELLDSLILPTLGARPNGEDSEWVARPKPDWDVLTSDLFTVNPIIFPGGDIGRLAASGIINDLAAGGATPRFFAVGLLMSASLKKETLRTVLGSFATLARAHNVEIVCGDTKILPAREPELVIWVTGIGEPFRDQRLLLRDVTPDHALIITGPLGAHSLAVLSSREGLGFERILKSDVGPLLEPVRELVVLKVLTAARDLTRGGLVGGLWEGVRASNQDWVVERDLLPIDTEVSAASSLLGLDPLSLTNEGCMLLAVPEAKVEDALEILRHHPETSRARQIGFVRAPRGPRPAAIYVSDGRETTVDYLSGIGVPRLC